MRRRYLWMSSAEVRSPAPSGVGLGLRWDFLEQVLEESPEEIAFFEVSPENYMRRGGYYPEALERVAERYPIVTHGLMLSLGAAHDPDRDYLEALRTEVLRLRSPWHSDHLCFSTAGELALHELLPLEFCHDNVERVADRLRRTEDYLGVPMAIENITWYLNPGQPEMEEAEFLNRVLDASGARLLLDINNVYVNSQNHGFDPLEFLAALPFDRVVQIHVAGHSRMSPDLLLDTHGAPVSAPVFELLRFALERTGEVPVLLERDQEIPELPELLSELRVLSEIYRDSTGGAEEQRATRA